MQYRFLLGLLMLPAFLVAQKIAPVSSFSKFNANSIEVVAFDSDGKTIIGGDSEGYIYFWDIHHGSLIKIMRAHDGKVTCLSISGDQQKMATAGADKKLIIWDLAIRNPVKSLNVAASLNTVLFGEDNHTLYYLQDQALYKNTCDLDSPVAIYQNRNSFHTAALDPESHVVGLTSGKYIFPYNLINNTVDTKIKCCAQSVQAMDIFNRLIACKCEEGSLNIFSLETGEQTGHIKGSSSYGQVILSHDGQFVVASNPGNMAGLWEVSSGKKLADLIGHSGEVTTFDFSRDDAYILTGSDDGTVKLWNTKYDKSDIPVALSPEDTTELVYTELMIPGKLQGRTVEKQETVEITSSRMDIFVWDNETVDGDIISLNFNGEWILREYSLTKVRKKIALNLNPHAGNYLILYAHNLGSNPPNTAAISFVNDKVERVLTIHSDLNKCGAVNFVFK